MSADDFIAPACEAKLKYLYQDEHLLVVDKPSGLLSVPGQNPLNLDSVLHRLKQRFPQVRLVHRLDFATSGLMVACLSDQAIAHLNRQFQSRLVQKHYTAVLAGHLVQDSGTIDLAIARDDFPRQKVCLISGKPALTEYHVLGRERAQNGFPLTRVLLKPTTGRTHQLRLHSLSIGHPIVGCDLYRANLSLEGREIDSYTLSERMLLHAGSLSFQHPETELAVSFESPCPF